MCDADMIAACAVEALLVEAAATPKPGLVDRSNNGAHRDMDFFTFQASAAVLAPYFAEFGRACIRCLHACARLDAQQNPPCMPVQGA